MKLVVTLLAAAVFASLICPASFVRKEEWDGDCPALRKCLTSDPPPYNTVKEGNKNCTCVAWGCVIDKVYYSGVGCEGEDMVCKDGVNEDISERNRLKLRGGECEPRLPKPPTTTTEESFTTTTSGTVESKYGAWKLAGMTLIGCFVFFFGGQLW